MVDSKENNKFDLGVKGLNPKINQHLHLISPQSTTAESFINIMRIRDEIPKLRSYDCLMNSPCQN